MVNYFDKIIKSMTDSNFGESIKKEKAVVSFKYFFILIVIVGSMSVSKFTLDIDKVMKEIISDIKSEFGNFELKNGTFIYYEDMPFIKEDGETAIVIDTTGITNEDVLKNYKVGAFISESKLVFKKHASKKTIYNFQDFKDSNFTKKQFIEIMEKMSTPLILFTFIMGMLVLIIWKILGVIILTIMAILVSAGLKIKLKYIEILKVTIYSITLPTIIKVILYMSEINIPIMFAVYYGIVLFYMVRYIRAYKEKKEENRIM
jgi:hypothetical protein